MAKAKRDSLTHKGHFVQIIDSKKKKKMLKHQLSALILVHSHLYWVSCRNCNFVQEPTLLVRLLTEVTGEEEGLCSWSPLLKKQAVVRLTLHAEGVVAACELVEASLCLFQLEKLLL